MALFTNIKMRSNFLPVMNTLAYYDSLYFTIVVQALAFANN